MERVEAWTVAQATDLLDVVPLPSPPPTRPRRGTSVTLDISLDEKRSRKTRKAIRKRTLHTVYKRTEPICRDSLKSREAVLQGKEGSRQRRRWENDRLVGNPYAQPPLPSDWEAQPTHPVRRVPYFLAPLWDAEFAHRSQERERRATAPAVKPEDAAAEKVAGELRAKLKKARGAKGLLQDLEEEVRGFVERWEEKEKELEADGLILPDSSDEEDNEIVFVGRSGMMHDETGDGKDRHNLEKDKLVFQSLVDDHGAAFGRYLVHRIAEYYNLRTWSKTTGNPARREAYVGLKTDPKTRRPSLVRSQMPRPLWAVV